MTLNPPTVAPPRERLEGRLDDPGVAAALDVILDHADLLALMVEGLSGFLERGDTITESVVEGVHEIRSAAADGPGLTALQDLDTHAVVDGVTRLAATLPKVAPALAAAAESGLIEQLTDADLLSPTAVTSMSVLARGLVHGIEADATHPAPISGPISLIKALRDDDVSRALGLFLTIAKSIGRELAAPQPAAASTGSKH